MTGGGCDMLESVNFGGKVARRHGPVSPCSAMKDCI